jgi:Tfp pilus assembly protein PilX
MGKWLLVLVVLVAGIAPSGCGKRVEVTIDHDQINKDKEAYQKKAEAALKDIDERIVDLKAKAKTAGAEIKAKADQDIEALSKKRDAASQRLAEIKSATAEKWDEVKSKTDAALDDLKKGFEKAFSHFK